MLRDQDFDVVVSDMILDGNSEGGYELLLEIKNKNPGIEVIVVTVAPQWEHAVQCMRAGCLNYGTKAAPEILRDTVIKALHLSRASGRRRSQTELLILANYEMVESEPDHNKKGKYLESLVHHLLGTIKGWTVQKARERSTTEEFDLVVRNDSDDPFWRQRGSFILVECKNWGKDKRKPGRAEYDAFLCKCMRRTPDYCRLGVFVSLNGVSKPFTQAARHPSGIGGPVLVTLDKAMVWGLICARDRSDWLKQRVHDHVFG